MEKTSYYESDMSSFLSLYFLAIPCLTYLLFYKKSPLLVMQTIHFASEANLEIVVNSLEYLSATLFK